MILTYAEYVDMDGDLCEQEFIGLEKAAEREIQYRTCGRLSETTKIHEKIKCLIFELLPLLKNEADLRRADAVSKVTNDGVSVEYALNADDVCDAVKLCIEKTLQFEKNDDGIPLLYCGVCV